MNYENNNVGGDQEQKPLDEMMTLFLVVSYMIRYLLQFCSLFLIPYKYFLFFRCTADRNTSVETNKTKSARIILRSEHHQVPGTT